MQRAALSALAGNLIGSQWLIEIHEKKQLPQDLVADAGKLLRNSPYQSVRNKALLLIPAPGKLDPKKPIDAAVLVAAGVVRRPWDGVKLLGTGELKSKLDITVYSATASARTAVEGVGGKLTTTKPAPAEADAEAGA